MATTTTRPSGLVLTKTDDRTIDWAYPPSGPSAKGQIRRSPNAGDHWSVSNLERLRSGISRIGRGPDRTLEQAIAAIERQIEAEQRARQEKADELRRKNDEEEDQARQNREEEQRLQEYMDDLFR